MQDEQGKDAEGYGTVVQVKWLDSMAMGSAWHSTEEVDEFSGDGGVHFSVGYVYSEDDTWLVLYHSRRSFVGQSDNLSGVHKIPLCAVLDVTELRAPK